MAATPGVIFAGKPTQVETGTHNGARNKPNEDRFDAFVGPGNNGQPAQFLVVADGVTSTHGGERASDIAVRVLRRLLQSPATSSRAPKPLRARLADAINAANQEILETARKDPDLKGMSTTLVVAAIDGDQLTLMHLGDSRAYLIRAGKPYQLTRDHTWIQDAMDEGRITPEQARTHPNRHVIQRYLGDARGVSIDDSILDPARPLENPDQTEMSGPTPRLSDTTMTLRPGDALLLCSDGLYNRISDDEIAAAATKYAPEKAVRSLIEQAVKRDEPDNITIVFWPTAAATVAAAGAARRPTTAIALAAAGILLALAAVWFIMSQSGGEQAGPPPGGETVALVAAASPTAEAAAAVPLPDATSTPEPAPEPAPDTPTAAPTDTATAPATATALSTDTPPAQPTATPLAQPPGTESPAGAVTVTATMTIARALDEFSVAAQAVAASDNPTNTAAINTDVADAPTPIMTAATTVTRAPTATPLTTATSTPTQTPMPTATPTRQPTPTRGQQTPLPTNASLAPTPSPATNIGPTSVRIQSPPDATASGQPVQFTWEPDRPLVPGQEYEVIFWRTNEDEAAGRGWVRSSTATSVVIDPERSPSADTYRWAVYLVDTEPYTRLRRISEVRTFTASVGGSGPSSGDSSGDGGGVERP